MEHRLSAACEPISRSGRQVKSKSTRPSSCPLKNDWSQSHQVKCTWPKAATKWSRMQRENVLHSTRKRREIEFWRMVRATTRTVWAWDNAPLQVEQRDQCLPPHRAVVVHQEPCQVRERCHGALPVQCFSKILRQRSVSRAFAVN